MSVFVYFELTVSSAFGTSAFGTSALWHLALNLVAFKNSDELGMMLVFRWIYL